MNTEQRNSEQRGTEQLSPPPASESQAAGSQAAGSQARSGEMIRALVGVAAVSGILISAVFQWTLPAIEANRAEALRLAVLEVIPGVQSTATFRITSAVGNANTGAGSLTPLGEDEKAGQRLYVGYDAQGRLAGVAIEAQGKGYQDVIKLLYGYAPATERIVGMKILDSKETPGLGDKIGKDPAFLANFAALDVSLTKDGAAPRQTLEVVKQGKKQQAWQIDAITGATISSKAVGNILNESIGQRLPLIRKNLDAIAEKP